ncbi:MAG: hypothetical protein V1862_03070 [Methanobacteriota archaeon]
MQKSSILVAIFGIVAVIIAWFLVGSAAAGIIFIIAATLLLCLEISADAARHLHPEIFASLTDDAQTVVVENLGTAPATSIKVRIIPENITYEIGDLVPDTTHTYELPVMVREAKAAVSWDKMDGTRTEKIFRLSGYTEETDPLRPTFPLFSWKEK